MRFPRSRCRGLKKAPGIVGVQHILWVHRARDMAETVSAAPASPKKAKASKPRRKPSHPKTSEMVVEAIKSLKERGGSSLQAIKKYIAANYKVDVEKLSPFLKKYLKSGVSGGTLIQTKGKGASGSFKLSASALKDKETKKPKAAKKKKATTATPKGKKPSAKKAVKKAPTKKAAAGKKPVAKKAAKKAPSKQKKAKSPKKPKAPKPKKAAKPKAKKTSAGKKK